MTSLHLSQGSKSPPSNRGKLRLYSNRMCPYAQRIRLILDAKKMQYETININLADKPDWYFRICPGGKVPALELENGDILYESLIIADYIDEKYPQHTLYPKDPLQKAKDKLMLHKFNTIISTMYKIITPNSRRYMEDQHVSIMEGLQVFEEELAMRGTSYFGGRKPGMLDYLIWPWCERADVLKLFGSKFVLKKERYGRLLEWRVAMREIKAVQKSYLDVEEHIEFLQSYRNGFPEYDSKL